MYVNKTFRKQVNKMSEEEAQFVLANWQKFNSRELSQILNKPVKYINQWLKQRGIKVNGKELLHKEDEELFFKLYPTIWNKDLLKMFPYLQTEHTIRIIAFNRGLKKVEEKGKSSYSDVELIKYFKKLYDYLGHFPLYREFRVLGGPCWSTYKRRFGTIQHLSELAGVKYSCRSTFVYGRYVGFEREGRVFGSEGEYFVEKMLEKSGFDDLIHNKCYHLYITNSLPEWKLKRFDWYSPSKDIYFEYFGLCHRQSYKTNADAKIELAKKQGIKLVCIYPLDFAHKSEKAFLKILQQKINQVL